MTTADFRDAVAKYAEDVAADHVALSTARMRPIEGDEIPAAWIEQTPSAVVHRTGWIPYVARVKIAGGLGLVVVPDSMADHVTPRDWEAG